MSVINNYTSIFLTTCTKLFRIFFCDYQRKPDSNAGISAQK